MSWSRDLSLHVTLVISSLFKPSYQLGSTFSYRLFLPAFTYQSFLMDFNIGIPIRIGGPFGYVLATLAKASPSAFLKRLDRKALLILPGAVGPGSLS